MQQICVCICTNNILYMMYIYIYICNHMHLNTIQRTNWQLSGKVRRQLQCRSLAKYLCFTVWWEDFWKQLFGLHEVSKTFQVDTLSFVSFVFLFFGECMFAMNISTTEFMNWTDLRRLSTTLRTKHRSCMVGLSITKSFLNTRHNISQLGLLLLYQFAARVGSLEFPLFHLNANFLVQMRDCRINCMANWSTV